MFMNLEVSETETEDSVAEEAVAVLLGAWITFGKPDVKSADWVALSEPEVFVALSDLVSELVFEVKTKDVGNQFKVLEEEAFIFEVILELATGLKVEVGNCPILVAWETRAE